MSTPLKIAREKRGLNIGELADALDVTRATISRIENAKKRPSPELAIRIADYFGNKVTRDQIIFPELYPAPAARKTTHRSQLQGA